MGSTDYFPLTPDYPISEAIDDGVIRSRSIGRTEFTRQAAPSQRIFHLKFSGASNADKLSLIGWYREFEADWFAFTFPDYCVAGATYHNRVFPVRFIGPPTCEWIANDQWNLSCDLIEAPGCALQSADYPDPADGNPTATISGTVTGADKIFIYSGYGFTYTGAGTITLDGTVVTSPKFDVVLALHRLYITGGSGTLEVVI
jgi:hypothetical protein